jgi:hypothetical protein
MNSIAGSPVSNAGSISNALLPEVQMLPLLLFELATSGRATS